MFKEPSSETQRLVVAAHGYRELGMIKEAWVELEKVPKEDLSDESVMLAVMLTALAARRWQGALDVALRGIENHPDCGWFYLHGAFAQHELQDTAGAYQLLVSGWHALVDDHRWWFDLARYELALGDDTQARKSLARAIELKPECEALARKDPALASLVTP